MTKMNISGTNTTIGDESVNFSSIDYCVVGSVLMMSLCIGIFFGRPGHRSKTIDNYLFGDHNMNSVTVAFALVASQLSYTIITIPMEIYAFGWQYALFIPTLGFFVLATNSIFLPILYQNNIDNCYTYLELRFSKLARNINIVAFITNYAIFLPVILFVGSSVFAEVTKLNIHVVNTILTSTCIIYTIMGGLKAIVWTQLVQGIVMLTSIILIAICGITQIGGMNEIWNRSINGGRIHVPDFSVDLTTRITVWNITINTFIIWTCHVTFSQNCIQRIASVASVQAAKRTMIIFILAIVTVMLFNCANGLIMYAYYHDCDPLEARFVANHEKLIPYFVEEMAGHISGMVGIFAACMISASLTIVSSALHSVSGILYNDFIRPRKLFFHSDAKANLTMQTIVFIFGVYCVICGALVERYRSIFQILNTIIGMTTGAKFGVYTIGLFWPSTNINGLLSGTALSMLIVCGLIVNTQYHISYGIIKHVPIPTSIDGCANETISFIQNSISNETLINRNDGFALHKISANWYTLIGCFAVWIPGVIVSYLTGGKDFNDVNFQLMAPCVRRFIPIRYRHTKLKAINIVKEENNH